jgi:hypothetical protein
MCCKRQDTWAVEVKGRLQLCVDFVAAEAVYHGSCCAKFFSTGSHPCATPLPAGRPTDATMMNAFEDLCEWLESSSDVELYSLAELQQRMIDKGGNDSVVYSLKQLKRKLVERYEDHIFFAEVQGRKNVLCFRNMASYIINAKWYTDKKEDVGLESNRIIAAAAKLIRAEIREQQYSTDRYPTNKDIRDREAGKDWVPPLLRQFIGDLVKDEVKQLAISNCIIQAARPRSVISPLLFGVGVELDHMFRSKWLINQLARLGFSISYDEVTRYKQSVLQEKQVNQDVQSFPSSFTQWVGDNVDHSIATLDGRGSFHGMGIIAVSTKTPAYTEEVRDEAIVRLKRSYAKDVVKKHGLQILLYCSPEKPGLSALTLTPMKQLQYPYTLPPSVNLDLLWSSGWLFPDAVRPQPNWSGFMQHVCNGSHPPTADISMLPIIDLNPSDSHCIYSTLCFVEQQSHLLNIVTPCITFDQPLWLKAVEIITATSLNIVCRLGGFHTMMSFLGSIGTLMSGSGLTDALEVCYGPNTVTHMMTGKAVSRAVRGHFMVDAALGTKLMKHILPDETNSADSSCVLTEDGSDLSSVEKLGPSDISDLHAAYQHAMNDQQSTDTLDLTPLLKLERSLCHLRRKLSIESRTSKLWLQYMDHIQTLKMFIRAERSGDWELHLVSITRMLNLFAATGHNQYAKCARIYVQIMQNLHVTHPWLFEQFTQHGYHTVRRSDRYWAGLWTDLVIEQVVMKSLKSRGGLTHGAGMTESVRLTWVHSMHKCAGVHQAMTSLTKLEVTIREQHAEMGKARASRDGQDIAKLCDWFETNDPFSYNDARLHCLSSGLTATEGDGINCDMAAEVGAAIQAKLDEMPFLEVTMKKSDQVKTLIQLQKAIVIDKKDVFIHTTHLFSRLVVLVERTPNMEPYFVHELTPLPASLFKDSRMRKPDKASLGRSIKKNAIITEPIAPAVWVLDGGSLLHRVRWSKFGQYLDVVKLYLLYIRKTTDRSVLLCLMGMTAGHQPRIRSMTGEQ